MSWEVRQGDCVELMRAMPAASVDAVVCDPPAGISFMNRTWDHHRGGRNEWVEWMADVLREALRVCKPGAHAFVWSLPRTSHWTGSALEMAGWEVRDVVSHMFGSGFPKSLDVGKAIDRQRQDNPDWQAVGRWLREQREVSGVTAKALCAAIGAHGEVNHGGAVSNWENGFSCPTWDQWEAMREALGFGTEMDGEVWRLNGRKGQPGENWELREKVGDGQGAGSRGNTFPLAPEYDVTAPATPEAEQWQGWGTALKPVAEFWWLARKPLSGTVAQTVLEHGTGALNVDATRIGASSTPACIGADSIGGSSPSREPSLSLHTLRTALVDAAGELPDLHSRLVASDLARAVGARPVPDFPGDCLTCSRCGDALARLAQEAAREAAPSPPDARSVLSRRWLVERIHELRCDDHPSSWDALGRIADSPDTGYSKGQTGRWPPNVCLSHSEGCVQVGTRKVKGSNPVAAQGEAPREYDHDHLYGGRMAKNRKPHDFTDGNGTETVGAWSCTPDCPVRLLDEQTGELHSQDPRTRQHPGASKFENQGASDGWRTERGAEGWYADRGGASRFFYVAKASRAERGVGLGKEDGVELRNLHPT